MTAEQYFLNKLQNTCVKLPEKPSEYLARKNYLQEFYYEDEKALARSNLGISPLLEELKELINRKVIDIGAVTWDLTPTEGHTESSLSSDTLWKIFYEEDDSETGLTKKLFYNRNDIDNKVQRIYNKIEENKIIVDDDLDENSTNPLLNRKVKLVFDHLARLISDLVAVDLTMYNLQQVNSLLDDKADKSSIYTKSEINNLLQLKANVAELSRVASTGSYNDLVDKPHIPNDQILSDWSLLNINSIDYIKNKPTKLSLFINDVGFITHELDLMSDFDPTEIINTLNTKADILSVPTKVSQLINDSGYINLHLDISGKANSSDLAEIATSGDYNDLLNKPTILQFIITTESEYELLTDYVQNAVYLVLEDEEPEIPEHTGWRLGDGLPIILSGDWKFGDNLPIILN